MTIPSFIKAVLPDIGGYLVQDLNAIKSVRSAVPADISHWRDLRKQINPSTGKINSYRAIRKITAAEGRVTPSLGSLRNYLGSGGLVREAESVAKWQEWFKQFGKFTDIYKEETAAFTTKEEWESFRGEYSIFMGWL